ncbi:hypothetical protein EYC84_000932 [Monilinia fructicola]|uniref:Uncharacterized protein n=1 Tax=Monilinia fructicola TaxID=38448 RepID=A0A5M9JJ12_MONFR|nr:hypothetical protein EYC84_000932 [Monilinia fructicola]
MGRVMMNDWTNGLAWWHIDYGSGLARLNEVMQRIMDGAHFAEAGDERRRFTSGMHIRHFVEFICDGWDLDIYTMYVNLIL